MFTATLVAMILLMFFCIGKGFMLDFKTFETGSRLAKSWKLFFMFMTAIAASVIIYACIWLIFVVNGYGDIFPSVYKD